MPRNAIVRMTDTLAHAFYGGQSRRQRRTVQSYRTFLACVHISVCVGTGFPSALFGI